MSQSSKLNLQDAAGRVDKGNGQIIYVENVPKSKTTLLPNDKRGQVVFHEQYAKRREPLERVGTVHLVRLVSLVVLKLQLHSPRSLKKQRRTRKMQSLLCLRWVRGRRVLCAMHAKMRYSTRFTCVSDHFIFTLTCCTSSVPDSTSVVLSSSFVSIGTVCPDYDLCSECWHDGERSEHTPSHAFVKIKSRKDFYPGEREGRPPDTENQSRSLLLPRHRDIHWDITCDGCGVADMKGIRYNCTV